MKPENRNTEKGSEHVMNMIIGVNRVLGTSKMSGGIFSEALLGVVRLKVSSWTRKYPKER